MIGSSLGQARMRTLGALKYTKHNQYNARVVWQTPPGTSSDDSEHEANATLVTYRLDTQGYLCELCMFSFVFRFWLKFRGFVIFFNSGNFLSCAEKWFRLRAIHHLNCIFPVNVSASVSI